MASDLASTCQCLCRVEHPDTAVTPRCTGSHQPGMHIVKSAPGVGNVAILVCSFCFQQNRNSSQSR